MSTEAPMIKQVLGFSIMHRWVVVLVSITATLLGAYALTHFARQQVNERLLELRSRLPTGAEPRMGPVSTGLGEIYMWTVGYADANAKNGEPGRQSNGRFLTPEGRTLSTDIERAGYLRTVQDWIV